MGEQGEKWTKIWKLCKLCKLCKHVLHSLHSFTRSPKNGPKKSRVPWGNREKNGPKFGNCANCVNYASMFCTVCTVSQEVPKMDQKKAAYHGGTGRKMDQNLETVQTV